MTKNRIFPNLIFQIHPIITPLILDQLACSLPKTNSTFHQLFKYARKMPLFHQLDEKIAKTFLADFICEVLYINYTLVKFLITVPTITKDIEYF